MIKIKLVILCLTVPFIISACSSVQQTTGNSKDKPQKKAASDSLYIFDALPQNSPAGDTASAGNSSPEKDSGISPNRMKMTYYAVQIGAFSTKERAEEFAAESRPKINYKIDVSFNPDVDMYVVRLRPEYTSHEEAERVRNSVWRINGFKDAWISTIQK